MSLDEPQIQDGVFDAIDAGLMILDADRRILAWNHWMAIATDVSATAALGRTLDDVFEGLINPRLIDAVTDALDSGVSVVLTQSLNRSALPLRTRDGRAMIHNVAVRRMARAPARALIQVTDVTIATDRDRVLRERQNARYDAVVLSAPDAIMTLSSDGVIQMANPAAAYQFGYDRNELTGMPITSLMQTDEPWASVWAAVMKGVPLARPVELMARRKDGSATCLEVSASGWESDKRIFVTAIMRDVNERRAAENTLRQLNQTLEQRVAERTAERDRMWRLSTDVMLLARLDGTIVSANPAWHSQFGWDEGALVGMSLSELIVEDDRAILRTTLEELGATRWLRLSSPQQHGRERRLRHQLRHDHRRRLRCAGLRLGRLFRPRLCEDTAIQRPRYLGENMGRCIQFRRRNRWRQSLEPSPARSERHRRCPHR